MMENENILPVADEIVLEATGITKKFPGVLANDNINFDLHKGEIHALLGENGAGKSTLMNVLYGLYKADSGEVRVDGNIMELHSPKDAIHHGIGMVHQHFMLIPVFTVTENIMLGAETDHRAAPNESGSQCNRGRSARWHSTTRGDRKGVVSQRQDSHPG